MKIEITVRPPDPTPPLPTYTIRVDGAAVGITRDKRVADLMGAATLLLAFAKMIAEKRAPNFDDNVLTEAEMDQAVELVRLAEGRADLDIPR